MRKTSGLINKHKNRNLEKGITLLEAIVSTAIIGIGFVAVFQMVQYSVRSIDVSGERTKANYIVGTIAEDIFAYKKQEKASKNFMDSLNDTPWKSETCVAGSNSNPSANFAEDNIRDKWNAKVSKGVLKCVDGQKDQKKLTMHKMCSDSSACSVHNTKVHDKVYVGRMEINMNNGDKTKYLYFQVK